MAFDPFFNNTYLLQGSALGEAIFNESLLRIAAGTGRVLSRTTTAPPGSPVDGDAYLIPSGATGAWETMVGNIAIFASGWKYMPVQAGMRMLIADEGVMVDFSNTSAPVAAALDGHITLTPAFIAAEWQINWNGALATSAQVTLADDTILKAPTNWRPGRFYTLHVIQDGTGGNALYLDTDAFYAAGGDITPNITTTANARSQLLFAGPTVGGRPVLLTIVANVLPVEVA